MAKKGKKSKDEAALAGGVKLGKYTLDFVCDRRETLMARVGERNTRMQKYARLYKLDFWEDEPKPDEQRVTLPIAFDVVQKMVALILGRPPVLTVPYRANDLKAQTRGQKLEGYLYGVMDRTMLYAQARQAEEYAQAKGEGWIKAVYEPNAADDEFPIRTTSPDPETVYARTKPGTDDVVEVAHTWKRARREIEDEWGVELAGLDKKGNAPTDDEALEDWLDELVDYSELWAVEIGQKEIKNEKLKIKDEGVVAEDAPPEGVGNAAAGESLGERMAAGGLIAMTRKSADMTTRMNKRVKRVVHCAWVGKDEENAYWIKKPVVVAGYKRPPFFGWAGIKSALIPEHGFSALYPLTNGDGGSKSTGILQAYNLLMSLDLDEAVRRAHASVVTDDPQAKIDTAPDGISTVSPGRTLNYLQQPPQPTGVQRIGETMSRMVDRVATPEVLNGQVFSLSGQAISGLASAFQMVVAARQHDREVALANLFGHVLALTKQYADPVDGWQAWGTGKYGAYVDEKVIPEDVGDDFRVIVKLSSSMPKDDMGMISVLSNLVRAKQISLETMLDQVQKLVGLASDSPTDEMQKILRDEALMNGTLGKAMADALGKDFRQIMGVPPEPPPAPAPAQSDIPSGRGMVMTPEMVGAMGNVGGMMNMQGAGVPGMTLGMGG